MKYMMCALALVLFAAPVTVLAQAVPGKPAPAFEVTDALGKAQKLENFKGKWLVLEWFNKDCPYVKKHYGSGNMQKLQKTYSDKGVAWLSVISSKKGAQGHLTPAEASRLPASHNSAASAVLLDESGEMGRAYGATATPHMFVINPKGQVVYAGAIDDNDSSNPEVIAKSKNYIVAALDAGISGKPVATASTRAYGCGIKY